MKKIVLLGDSIRMGYDKYVKEAFAGVAEVYYPNDNCAFATHTLRYVHEWKAKGNWPDDVDLVHWNVGLWDALELFGDEPMTPIPHYAALLPRLDKRFRMLFPRAKMIFATSTPVNEKVANPDFIRHNATIEKYNAAAIEALSSTDTLINDLYPYVASLPNEYHSDWVHYYTPEGTAAIGGRVIATICKELGISATDVKIENFEPEKYTKDKIGG